MKEAIEGLKRNALAKESELYIFSDAPKPGDEYKVSAVRQYAHTIDGFKEVHVVERETNDRVKNNRGGIDFLLNKYGRVIFLEEDVVAAPGFLRFMNDALDFYENDQRIGSITAYCPPIRIPDSYKKDVFVLTRFNPWGVGLWQRYNKMNANISEYCYKEVYGDKKRLKALARAAGQDIVELVTMDFEKKLDAGDMKSTFWQFYDDKLMVYPRKSLSQSIGQDGTGTIMGLTDKWDVSDIWDKEYGFEFCRNISIDETIQNSHYAFYKIPFKSRVVLRALTANRYL